jgi:hypothetical protein
MRFAGVPLVAGDYAHFLASLTLCGMAAATYPFFAVTAYSVRALYPVLVEPAKMHAQESADLDWLERISWFYLAQGFLLPMLAVMLMVTLGGEQHRVMLGVLSAGSLVGVGALVWLARTVQGDVLALREFIEGAGRTDRA